MCCKFGAAHTEQYQLCSKLLRVHCDVMTLGVRSSAAGVRAVRVGRGQAGRRQGQAGRQP